MVPTAGSTKPSIIDSIPDGLVMLLAAPYLSGRTREDAVKLAHKIFAKDRFTSTIDLLGEDSESDEQCDLIVEQYKSLIETVSLAKLPTPNQRERITVSMKPSMFSACAPSAGKLDDAYRRIKSVVDFASEKQVNLTLEAEDYRWTDFHLDAYFALIGEGYKNLGTVLQSRLFRTRNDLKRFDERMRVRLVIGIYNELPEIAHTEKPIMKQLLLEYAGQLSERGTYVELATHDTECLSNFFKQVALPLRLPASRFETQFLMGVPRKKVQNALRQGSYFRSWKEGNEEENDYLARLSQSGVLVRLYLPFGDRHVAGPYCKRRLKANPNMIGYGIKNLLNIQ